MMLEPLKCDCLQQHEDYIEHLFIEHLFIEL